MRAAIEHFEKIAPVYMARFIDDFAMYKVGELDAAAVFGNLGHESVGLTVLQEVHPVVQNSRGGYGWAQWTATRRRLYENWCKTTSQNPADDTSNYGYLAFELQHDYRHAFARLLSVQTLNAKTAQFERYFEGAGVANMNSRIQWAVIALNAFRKVNYGTGG